VFDPEPVCDAIGVVEVGNDLAGVVDFAIIEASRSELGDVVL
jgi:hypothetical protein